MMGNRLNRRDFLWRSALIGCSAAASPLVTPMSFAAAPWDNRLVVLILRGALDGLDALRPVGDPNFATLRPDRGAGTGVALDGAWELHPALAPLVPLWRAGELGFVNATSTPYRDKRSHFDGQDILEAGTTGVGQARDGWLNRMLQAVPGIEAETTYSIGRGDMLLTTGAAPVSNWSPDAALSLSPQTERLLEMVTHDDPLFRDALGEALVLSGLVAPGLAGEILQMAEMMEMAEGGAMDSGGVMDRGDMQDARKALAEAAKAARSAGGYDALARFAAQKLRAEARIATFSINGWDTHAAQHRTLQGPLESLASVLLTLRDDLGPAVWGKTAVVAMTEFGRTARLNGTGGSDHGTAGLMIYAGGALRGQQVTGGWPGLAEADLYARRDLLPLSDVRAHAAGVMQGLFGLDRAVLEGQVFPGLDMSGAARLVL
ncbi:hypothetical protein PSM7751_01716 [Pseudooceanicola marinus]|uniref:Twin-arginine translocation pathway signal n=1 Tax=Pseudooceanicola marinus TaxID=396013 RepID=A0A1X6Z2L7_9RHOB|nr:DUF1501 domain-containing protein [Pseudooceanicola marinus]PJE32393.1 DUF1501 domain-containing protein [Pseudooceanicola marinus]SLN38208.1 hypothetical protein PSM7751_01716 [Pseudooceanicola marinus]